jgi:hypothetical protein
MSHRKRALVTGLGALVGVAALVAQAASGSAGAAAPTYSVDGTIRISWTETGGFHDSGSALYAVSGPLLTNVQRQAYAPVVVPKRFSFRPAEPGLPWYLHAQLRSVSWTRTETIEGCGDGSQSATRTSTVEKITDPRAIFDQPHGISVNRLGGTSTLNLGAITMYIWQDGLPLHGFTAYSNLGAVSVRATGGCPEVLNGGPGTRQVQMHDLLGLAMMQLSQLELHGQKTAEGTFSFHGVNTGANFSPSPGTHNTVKVTIDLRVTGTRSARGVLCVYPNPAQLASARTVADAQAILRRAGIFDHYGGDLRNPNLPAGHYFYKSGSPDGYCGIQAHGRPHLYRSIH